MQPRDILDYSLLVGISAGVAAIANVAIPATAQALSSRFSTPIRSQEELEAQVEKETAKLKKPLPRVTSKYCSKFCEEYFVHADGSVEIRLGGSRATHAGVRRLVDVVRLAYRSGKHQEPGYFKYFWNHEPRATLYELTRLRL